ncbi:hypothetical protein Vretifemale_5729, partial [Volvox reticuliferus]
DYLDLDAEALVLAYGKTARLYRHMYGEPYDGPDTAWLPEGVRHPLSGPTSPVAFALRVFEEAALSPADTAVSGGPVGRAGAHGLYLAWLVGKEGELAFDHLTCVRCCWIKDADVHMHALEPGTHWRR